MPDNKPRPLDQSRNVPADEYKGDNFLDDVFFPDVELAQARRPAPKKRRQTPHAELKHRCRAAMTAWRQRTGYSLLLLPSIVGQVTVDDGTRGGKRISVGRKGQSDDTILVGKDGVLWGVICAEYKAGSDYQKHAQQTFEAKATRVGALYVIVRIPVQLTDALDQVVARRGGLF